MRKNKRKTTKAFKQLFLVNTVLPMLRKGGFYGSFTLIPYHWNGEQVFAKLDIEKVLKLIEFDFPRY